GRGESRRPPRVPHQLAVHALGRAVLSGRDSRLDGQAGRRPERWDGARPALHGRNGGWHAAAPGAAPGRRRLVRFLLLSVMTALATWPWAALALLGAVHGLNPGMGWLFAVALGMQEGRTRAVWRALSPLALGHALAVGAAVLAAAALGRLLPAAALQWIIGGLLLGLGALRLVRHRHPRYGGMRVGFR